MTATLNGTNAGVQFSANVGVALAACKDNIVDEMTLRIDYEGEESTTVTAHVWSER